MRAKIIICAFCNESLISDHGNTKYHPECALLKHNSDSTNRYALQSSMNDPWWVSTKVLKDALRQYGTAVELDPVELLYEGFDFELPFTITKYKDVVINSLGNIGFSINKNKTIQLWTL